MMGRGDPSVLLPLHLRCPCHDSRTRTFCTLRRWGEEFWFLSSHKCLYCDSTAGQIYHFGRKNSNTTLRAV